MRFGHDPIRRAPPSSAPIPGGLFGNPEQLPPSPPVAPPGPRYALDDPPRATARQRTRWTVQDEAFRAAPTGVCALVLDAVRAVPSTCDELEQRLDLTHQTCSAAVNSLMRAGRIVADGERPTRSGRAARVWRVVEGNSNES